MRWLETERLLLRTFDPADFDAVHSYAGDAEATKYTEWGPNSPEQTRQFLALAMAGAAKEPMKNYQYAAVLKQDGTLIGACNLTLDEKGAEIGWIVHPDDQKQGMGTEMGTAMLELGFDERKLRRIAARCDAENIASSRVMEKIGMTREGLLIDGWEGKTRRGDELRYGMTKDQWEIKKEIAYYHSLPAVFDGFISVPRLTDGEIYLVCLEKKPANPEKQYVPAYDFAICRGGERIGQIGLRIGYTDGLYYGGQIGYAVDEQYRGSGYAGAACRLVLPVARAHHMPKLLITNNVTNAASRRVCEKLGCRLVRAARLPQWTELYQQGMRAVNVFELQV